jgi:hypothetical protein
MARSKSKKRRNSNQDDSGRDVRSIKTEAKATPKPKIKAEPKPTPKPEDKLIIALDFGTTFSGIAYSFKGQQDPKVVAITNWPGRPPKPLPDFCTFLTHCCRC